MTDETIPFAADRRQAARLSGDAYPLRVGRHPARLVDWSTKGIGLQLQSGAEEVAPGQALTVSIHSEVTNGVALFPIIVRRMDVERAIIGADFLDDAEGAADFLARLLAVSAAPDQTA
ncbi:PilZ domain-containing protein [Nitrospirillum sp. BR 11163]|uniref:PilZ domain-containing protein n=1 Tax=Nitrospirillum sp. BR 11163 TaxID=3104323 RepID=UPI002AFF9D79|nr:PilZ domain-containing protein [Nitrospirillum sp. BR 11163]MEA1672976.1 PilZ domain-containing protein [Nitrospirillum sp. BR 11163]